MQKYFLILIFQLLPVFSWSQTDSIYYHDYSFESQYGASGAYPSQDYMQMLARFTPSSYPVKLSGVMVWFRNATQPAPFKILVRHDAAATANANNSTQVFLSSIALPNPSSGGIPDFAYPSYVDLSAANLIFSSGDIYAGVTQNLAVNGFVGFALDTNANLQLSNRAWISTSQGSAGSWMQFMNWSFIPSQLGVTAFFDVLPNAVIEPASSTIKIYPDPVTDKFFIRNVPSEKCTVNILSIDGKVLKTFRHVSQSSSYDIGNLTPGIYLVEIKSDNNLHHIRIVKR